MDLQPFICEFIGYDMTLVKKGSLFFSPLLELLLFDLTFGDVFLLFWSGNS